MAEFKEIYTSMKSLVDRAPTVPGGGTPAPRAEPATMADALYKPESLAKMKATEAPTRPPDPIAASLYPSMKPAEQPKGAAPALELKLPAGWKEDNPTLGDFRKAAGEFGLEAPKAQRLLDLHQRALTQMFDRNAWEAAAKSDTEIGGAGYGESVRAARELVDKHGTPELRRFLNETGFGNHPELIRLLARVGRNRR